MSTLVAALLTTVRLLTTVGEHVFLPVTGLSTLVAAFVTVKGLLVTALCVKPLRNWEIKK